MVILWNDIDIYGVVAMKDHKLKVTIAGFEDEKGFKELLAELQVAAVMKMCPPELRVKVLDNAIKKLTSN